jgi:histidinol-phosphate aminotransferase
MLMQTRAPNPRDPEALVRPIVRSLQAYVPGEQPKVKGLVKLNTNENPYPPAPKVLSALAQSLDQRLRLYPNPTADRLRRKLADFHHCSPENIIVGNGSDELLALATRAFVEPLTGLTHYALQNASHHSSSAAKLQAAERMSAETSAALVPSRYAVQFFHPSYSLYPVLAAMHGAWPKPVALGADFALPSPAELRERNWDFAAALTYVTTPHAPSGRGFARRALEELCSTHAGVIVLDEAYVDFADEDALALALKFPNVLVSRTFSKAYSLCFLRVGYFVGHPTLIAALQKIRDSYNVNGLGQLAAEAALDSRPYYRDQFRRVLRSRKYLSHELAALGFRVLPSQTNFVFVQPPAIRAETWLQKLRQRKVLVRWFGAP